MDKPLALNQPAGLLGGAVGSRLEGRRVEEEMKTGSQDRGIKGCSEAYPCRRVLHGSTSLPVAAPTPLLHSSHQKQAPVRLSSLEAIHLLDDLAEEFDP